MKKRLLFLIAALLVIPVIIIRLSPARPASPVMPPAEDMIKGCCSYVIDGDTAYFEIVEDSIPVAHSYRFIGVDTPETVHRNKPVEPYGKEASAFTGKSLLKKWVYIEYDVEKIDAYGRHLCYVWLEDGTLFNLKLLEQGYGKAMAIAPNEKYEAFFMAAQNRANRAGIGIWSVAPATATDGIAGH